MTAPAAIVGPTDARASALTVVWNRGAGRKAGLPTNVELTRDELIALFARAGLEVDLHATVDEAEAVEVTRHAAEAGVDTVVAAGGDGTAHVVARTLLETADGPALGIMPLGSVMNIARSLGISRDLDEAARILRQRHVRRLDIGDAGEGRIFLEGVAIGLHAELFREVAAFDAGDRGAPVRAIRTALRYRPSRLTLVLDDGRIIRTRALVTSVSNGPYAGLGFTVAPNARLDDGRFDIRVFERFSRLELLRHFWSIVAGRRTYEPRVTTLRAANVRISSATPLRVRADGEDIAMTPVELRVRHRALRVVAPEAPSDPPEPQHP